MLGTYVGGSGCDLYELELTTQHERRLAVSSSHHNETLPTVWGDTVAYVRDGTHVMAGGRGLAGGFGKDGTPVAMDLHGHSLAFAWSYAGDALGPASDLRV